MESGSNIHFCCLKEIEDMCEKNFTLLLMKISLMGDSVVKEGKEDFFLKAVILKTKTEVSFVVHAMGTVFEEAS